MGDGGGEVRLGTQTIPLTTHLSPLTPKDPLITPTPFKKTKQWQDI